MYYQLIKNGLVLGVIVFLINSSIVSSFQIYPSPQPLSRGNWLYVGGTEPGNYTTIQSAIENASNGDTIFVYNGTYYENLVIDKSINLFGQNRDTTFIDGRNKSNVITINFDKINISGFTIQNCSSIGLFGIQIKGSNVSIFNNNITGTDIGIKVIASQDIVNHKIFLNNIFNNRDGVSTENIWFNLYINNNSIFDNSNGISLWSSSSASCIIEYNRIFRNIMGINFFTSDATLILSHNDIFDNEVGINLEEVSWIWIMFNKIYKNNLGIFIYRGLGNFLYGNQITENQDGIYLFFTLFNRIISNNISNKDVQINLFFSELAIIRNNNIWNNNSDIIVLIKSSASSALAFMNWWGFKGWPRRGIQPIFALVVVFPWTLTPNDIPQTWPN